jgi:hypothetical protein
MLIHAKICHACEHYDRGKCRETGELAVKYIPKGICPLGKHANATAEHLAAVEKFALERGNIVQISYPRPKGKRCCGETSH